MGRVWAGRSARGTSKLARVVVSQEDGAHPGSTVLLVLLREAWDVLFRVSEGWLRLLSEQSRDLVALMGSAGVESCGVSDGTPSPLDPFSCLIVWPLIFFFFS